MSTESIMVVCAFALGMGLGALIAYWIKEMGG